MTSCKFNPPCDSDIKTISWATSSRSMHETTVYTSCSIIFIWIDTGGQVELSNLGVSGHKSSVQDLDKQHKFFCNTLSNLIS